MGAEAGRGQVDRYWHTLLGLTRTFMPTETEAFLVEQEAARVDHTGVEESVAALSDRC